MSRKGFLIAVVVITVLIAGLLVWAFNAEAEKTWDVCYEMTNVNVSWEQTYFPGSWDGV